VQSQEPPKAPIQPEPKKEEPKKQQLNYTPSADIIRSIVTVDMPVGAKLYVNNSPQAISSRDGHFETPVLPVGQTFVYNFKAVVELNGQKLESTRQVIFKAGEAVQVDFRGSETARN
jgi:uncharacterized protein (TIGR03000 family)